MNFPALIFATYSCDMKRLIFTLSVLITLLVGCSDPSNSSVPTTDSEFSVWSSPYNEVAVIDGSTFYLITTYDYVSSKSLTPQLPVSCKEIPAF